MFRVHDRSTGAVVRVFGVHKSGPQDEQTKFLVHDGRSWRWMWASRFEPVESRAVPSMAPAALPSVVA